MKAQKTGRGVFRVQHIFNGKRITIYLGKKINRKEADRQAIILGRLFGIVERDGRVPPSLQCDIMTLPDNVRNTIQKSGIFEQSKLRRLFESHKSTKEHLKKGTLAHYQAWYDRLERSFGDCELSGIRKDDCEKFRACCLTELSSSSVSRGIRTCRTIFRYAVENGYIVRNPFEGIKTGTETNVDRMYYVDRATIEKILVVCQDDMERLAVCLARFCGLRVPSEIRHMTYDDMTGNIVRIHEDTKTGAREVPMFREAKTFIERMDGGKGMRVFDNRYKYKQGTWKILKRLVNDSGVPCWPKLWTNLRSSCVTDFVLMGYSDKALDSMFGNSARVRNEHYVQFQKDREYQKMLDDNVRIVEYLSTLGGRFDVRIDPLFLRDFVLAERGSKIAKCLENPIQTENILSK